MEEYIKRYGRNSLIISILLLIFSVLLIFKPIQSINALVVAFGVIVVLTGVIHVISYFKEPKELQMFNFELLEGIAGILIGLVIIGNAIS